MITQREKVDSAVRRAEWRSFIADVRGGWWIALASALAILAIGYWRATPRDNIGPAYGIVTGAHQRPSETGSAPLELAVLLENGRATVVSLPRSGIYRAAARVELQASRRAWWPHLVRYRFVRYAEPQTDSINAPDRF